MSLIHSKNTKPEIAVRKYLVSKGFRYKMNVKGLLDHPDIVLPKYQTIVFGMVTRIVNITKSYHQT